MTERDEKFIHRRIISDLENNPDGLCQPLAITGSLRTSLSGRAIDILPNKIVNYFRSHTDNPEADWLNAARIFWPEAKIEDVAFRSS